MKRPAFQFYPGDWLRSPDLRACSVGARGLWIDMLCLMHEGTPYGHLRVGETVIHPLNLARIVGADLPDVERWISELKSAGVCSVDRNSCIFSRRMVRDERKRSLCASAGKKGGNPLLLNGANNHGHKGDDKGSSKRKLTAAVAVASINQGLTTETKESPVDNPDVKTNGQNMPGRSTPSDWWITQEGIDRKGRELSIPPLPREEYRDYKDRLFKAIEERKARPG